MLRAADAAAVNAPTNLLGISRPCALPLAQRREAVRHVCRLVRQLAPASLDCRMLLEALHLLLVDSESGPAPQPLSSLHPST